MAGIMMCSVLSRCQTIQSVCLLCTTIMPGIFPRAPGVRGGSIGKGRGRLSSIQPDWRCKFRLSVCRSGELPAASRDFVANLEVR